MWVQELRKMVGPDIVLCIAGNKIDLAKDRAVDHEQAEEYAQSGMLVSLAARCIGIP
jgi:GTPase SAR1 family protein